MNRISTAADEERLQKASEAVAEQMSIGAISGVKLQQMEAARELSIGEHFDNLIASHHAAITEILERKRSEVFRDRLHWSMSRAEKEFSLYPRGLPY